MRLRTFTGLAALALIAGVGSGEIIYRSKICRDAIGHCFGRGDLLALINGRGIYEIDVMSEITADRYLAEKEIDVNSKDAVLRRLIANENLRHVSDRGEFFEKELQREFDLLRYQFADDKLWTKRIADNGNSLQWLRQLLRENLSGRRWIEQETTNQLAADDDSVRSYYAQHSVDFVQPLRLRASHIFLAASPQAPSETVEAKQKLIDSLAARIHDGEEFEPLVWEASEDEASKPRGGDLGYFSQWRMPEDFFATVSQLKIGETSKPVRSKLGFHIVRVTEIKPARQMAFEEVRFEIAARLTNQRRMEAVENLTTRLSGSSALRDGWFWN